MTCVLYCYYPFKSNILITSYSHSHSLSFGFFPLLSYRFDFPPLLQQHAPPIIIIPWWLLQKKKRKSRERWWWRENKNTCKPKATATTRWRDKKPHYFLITICHSPWEKLILIKQPTTIIIFR